MTNPDYPSASTAYMAAEHQLESIDQVKGAIASLIKNVAANHLPVRSLTIQETQDLIDAINDTLTDGFFPAEKAAKDIIEELDQKQAAFERDDVNFTYQQGVRL